MSKISASEQKSRSLLQVFLIEFEEDLQSGTKAGRLDFPPKSALVASHTVHDPTNVSKVLLELLFQDLSKIRQVGPSEIHPGVDLHWHSHP